MKTTDDREEMLFRDALQRPVGPDRQGFLDQACGGQPALRQRLEALLAAHDHAGDLLATPPQPARPTLRLELPDAPDEAVGQTIGRYKLLEKVGEGGMGLVYVAEQTEPVRRRVALKIIRLGMDTRAVVARFEVERQALALMDHPNIAKVLDAGATETGRPYFVMELVRGIKITDYCDQNNLSAQDRVDVFIKVCQAIQHAHQKGIIHRDIKPSNILVTLHDGVPVPKVIDFGIAKATEGRLAEATVYTQLHQFIGTPAYMSPEQAEMSGLDIDTRSDIYSLGALLYELLAGSTPFDPRELMAAGIDAMRKTIREREPARPSTRLATLAEGELTAAAKHRSCDAPKLIHLLRGDLDWIVMKCLEKDRSRRYATANGLAADLLRHLQNEPVVARPPSGAYRFQKMVRRNQLAFAAAGLVAAALLAGLGLATWALQRERQARAKEQRLLYGANLNLAQQAWDQNNLVRFHQLLEETRDFPGRGFEWYYWQRQAHRSLRTFGGAAHLGSLTSVAYSPDGQSIATTSLGGTPTVWDVASGAKRVEFKGHGTYDRYGRFFPTNVAAVAFAPDGRRMVTGSDDGTARVWDTATGKELLTLAGHTNGVRAVAFAPDGGRIVTGGADATARIWDAATGKELRRMHWQVYRINSVAFSPDGRRIVTGDEASNTAKVWDAASGEVVLTLEGWPAARAPAVFSPDGRTILTASWDRTATLWDAANGRQLRSFAGHSSDVTWVTFSPDGKLVLAGLLDGNARVWDAASGVALLTLKEHTGSISAAAFSPDSQRIATASYDCTAKLWDVLVAPEPLTLNRPNAVNPANQVCWVVHSVAFSPDGQHLVTASDDQTARVLDTASGRELVVLRGHTGGVYSAAFSPDGLRVVTGSDDQTARIWEVRTGRELHLLKGHTSRVERAVFSPDGQRIATASDDKTAKVWEAGTGRELLTFKGHDQPVSAVAFAPDGRRIVSGSWDWSAKVWDAATGNELLTLELWDRKGRMSGTPVAAVDFSPDGRRIITATWDRTAQVWDAATGRRLLTLSGHNGQVSSAAFSPDGRRIVTGSGDKTVKLWDAISGREVLTLKASDAPAPSVEYMISAVAFSPDGHRLVAGSYGGLATVWEDATGEQLAAWQREEFSSNPASRR